MRPPKDQSWQFRDQKVPARLWYLLREGRINTTDLLLMAVIDPLVRPQGDERGLGCFASNRYLMEATRPVSKRSSPEQSLKYVSERLNYLASLGLILIIRLDDVRYLELEWSRTAEERAALEGTYGAALRAAYKKLEGSLPQPDPPVNDRSLPSGLKPDPPSGLKPDLNSKEEVLKKEKKIESLCRPSFAGTDGERLKTILPTEEELKVSRSVGASLASLLFEGLVSRRKLTRHLSSLSSWTATFNEFLRNLMRRNSLSEQEAAALLASQIRTHLDHLDDRYWPKLYSATSFCDNEGYLKLENAIKRLDENKTADESKALFEAAQEAIEREGRDYLRIFRDGRLQVRDHGRWIKDDLDDPYREDWTIPPEVRKFFYHMKSKGGNGAR